MKILSFQWVVNDTNILTSRHFLSEECDHLGEVDGPRGLSDQVVGLAVCDRPTNVDEGSLEVISCDNTILVHINDAKGFLEFLDLLLTEEREDVRTRLLCLLRSLSRLEN